MYSLTLASYYGTCLACERPEDRLVQYLLHCRPLRLIELQVQWHIHQWIFCFTCWPVTASECCELMVCKWDELIVHVASVLALMHIC